MRKITILASTLLLACGSDSESDSSDASLGQDASAVTAPVQRVDAQVDGSVDMPLDAELEDSALAPGDASSAPLDAQPDANAACTQGIAQVDVVSVSARGPDGKAPRKGDVLSLTLVIENRGAGGTVELTPLLTSQRFSDYVAVPLAKQSVALCPGRSEVVISGGPFLASEDNKKQFALGSGGYRVASIRSRQTGQGATSDTTYDGATFTIETSNALLVPVVYDQRYLQQLQGNTSSTPEAYLKHAFTRPNEIFTPSGSDPDGAGNYQRFNGGFDEMMNVRHLFRAFPGFPGESTTAEGWCEDAAAYGKQVLGMQAEWNGQPSQTRPERHGFDYLIALQPDMGGGVACGWLDVQVSSFINRDLDRQQVIAVHETGHIFGAPHCDDVGNGSGGSLQGYVMCSGEKHAHYPQAFVWHSTSRTQMRSHWN